MSEDKHSALASAKEWRGVVQASITRLERRVDMYETKEELSHTDRLAVQRLIKKFETLDTEFCQHHYTVTEMLDDEAVEEEQATLDYHDERVTDLVERLQQLVLEQEESASGSPSGSADASMPLQRQ